MPIQKSHTATLDKIESELNSVLDQDNRYWRENDAKFRAVAQNVSYEQFEEIVKASHLKPLDKSDKSQLSKPKSSIWNSIANVTSRKSASDDKKVENDAEINKTNMEPKNVDEFYDSWKNVEKCERITFLEELGQDKLKKVLSTEIPSELIVDFIHTFLSFAPSASSEVDTLLLATVVRTLELVTHSRRFSLSVQFLSAAERAAGQQLMEKLRVSLTDRQQDLAELGVTEWNIENIANKFQFQ